jgi:hypothetical protein
LPAPTDFVSERSADRATEFVTLAALFVVSVSVVEVDTLAVLVIVAPEDSAESTLAAIVTDVLVPTATAPTVQVTIAPAALHLLSEPAASKVKPAGSVSVTVTASASPGPLFQAPNE